MLFAAAVCQILQVPYLMRGDSQAESAATGLRLFARHVLASFAVRGAAGALTIGQLNADFYARYGRIPRFWAPYSIDNDRFRAAADVARCDRSQRLASLGLDPQRPVVIFSGKLIPIKRPLDAVQAIEKCKGELSLLVIGDGPLRSEIRKFEARLPVRCLGFVNQTELPRWYACGDVLVLPSIRDKWGLVVNEGMACGLVPVVSDAVGSAPDLVEGVGKVVPVGDIHELARALLWAANCDRDQVNLIRRKLEHFTITETARGYEQAALALRRKPRR